jgi:hypothetical protein
MISRWHTEDILLKNFNISVANVLVLLVPLTIVAIAWFSPYSYHAVMGDDLYAITASQNGGFASSFWKAFSHAPLNKYRPITDIVFRAEILMFGKEMLRYIQLNIVIEIINSFILSFICWRVSQRKISVALLGGILFIVSRFSYYNIVQIFGGALEGVALFFVLLQVCMVVLAFETRELKFLMLAVVSYACALFTHERFMVMGVFIFFSIIWAPIDYKQRFTKYYLACIPVLILFSNFAIKVFWLKSNFFEGGGGTAIDFNLRQFLTFCADGLLNLCGFNVGPKYLSGIHVSDAGLWGITLGVFFCTVIVALVWVARAGHDKNFITLKKGLLFCSLLIPLLAAASITFRQEYRWLYAPYAVFVVAICYTLGCVQVKKIRLLFTFIILLSAFNIETFYRLFNENIYFFSALRIAESAQETVIKNLEKHPEKSVYLYKAKDTAKWIFQKNDFFRYYSNNPRFNVNYVNDLTEIPYSDLCAHKVFVYAQDENREIIDVTAKALEFLNNGK